LVNFHASGFILPHHGTNDEFCRQISRETKYTVLDSSYRVAPEHSLPVALNDVEDAVSYVRARPEKFGLTPFIYLGL
jgi:acetyl esterase/lipase